MGKVYVAVYGSLRTGMENFSVNISAGAKSLGNGFTDEPYRLSRYGKAYFPVVSLKKDDAVSPIRVEVFETDKQGLEGPYDRLEGYPSFYNRTEVPVTLDTGEKVNAWIYHIDDIRCHGDTVENGDWVSFKK